MAYGETDAASIIRRYEGAAGDQLTFKTHWQEVADLVLPTRDFTKTFAPGQKRHNWIFEDTAAIYHAKLASAIISWLCPRSRMWFNLATRDEAVNQNERVQAWLQDSRNRMMLLFANESYGFYGAADEMTQDLTAFGFGVQYMKRRPDRLRFMTRPPVEAIVDVDDEDKIDTVYRCFKLSPRQSVMWFGAENLSPETAKKAEGEGNTGWQSTVELIHCVEPRRADQRDPARMDAAHKPWASYYVEKAAIKMVMNSGYDEFPYLTPRWSKAGGEKYGRSPAMACLPSNKMAQSMTKDLIVGSSKIVNPPLLLPDDGMMGPIRTSPGSLIYYRAGMPSDAIRPLDVGSNPKMGMEVIDAAAVSHIKRAFYADLIEMPDIDRQTATEVQARQAQRLEVLGPVVGRLQQEWLEPCIKFVFRTMMAQGAFLPPPPELKGHVLEVHYSGQLANSQRAGELVSIQQTMQQALPLIQTDPSLLQVFNGEEVIRLMAMLNGANPAILRSRADYQKLVQAQQQAQTQQQQAAQAQQMAGAAKDAGGAAKNFEAAPKTSRALAGMMGGRAA